MFILGEAIDDVDAGGAGQNGLLNVGGANIPDLDGVVLACGELCTGTMTLLQSITS